MINCGLRNCEVSLKASLSFQPPKVEALLNLLKHILLYIINFPQGFRTYLPLSSSPQPLKLSLLKLR